MCSIIPLLIFNAALLPESFRTQCTTSNTATLKIDHIFIFLIYTLVSSRHFTLVCPCLSIYLLSICLFVYPSPFCHSSLPKYLYYFGSFKNFLAGKMSILKNFNNKKILSFLMKMFYFPASPHDLVSPLHLYLSA